MDPISKSSKKRKSETSFHPKRLFLLTGIIMELLLILNLLWSCSSTFPCPDFLPTISYLACFRGHDRLFTFTMTFWGGNLAFFSLFAYQNFKNSSDLFNKVFLLTSLLISLVQPGIAIFDEANTSYFVKIEKIHAGIMIGLFIACMIWIFLTGLTGKLRKELKTYLNLFIFCACWSFVQWIYAEKDQFPFNYHVEAVSEWITVTFAVFLPYAYSVSFEETVFATSIRKR